MILRRAISSALALLILLGNAGISLHGHYCKEQLRKLNLFTTPESCHQTSEGCHSAVYAPAVKSCCKLPGTPKPLVAEAKDDCCSNQAQVLHLDTETDNAPAGLLVLPFAFATLPVAAPLPALAVRNQLVDAHHTERPPPGGRQALQLFSLLRC